MPLTPDPYDAVKRLHLAPEALGRPASTMGSWAYLLKEPGRQLVRTEIRLRRPSAGQILVRLIATGICHADIYMAEHPPFALPAILGHEGAGIVEEIGEGVVHVVPGDHVVLSFSSCGTCLNCRADHEAHCLTFFERNFGGAPLAGTTNSGDATAFFFGQSSFATHAIADASCAVPVRRDAPLDHLGPLGCGVQTGAGTIFNVLRPLADSVVMIAGAGAVGLSAVMAAKHLGCRTIIVADRLASRLALATDLGATQVLELEGRSFSEAIAHIPGIDAALDTTGALPIVQALVAKLRPGGTVAIVSGDPHNNELSLDLSFLLPGRRVVGVTEGDAHPPSLIPRLVDMFMAGELPLNKIISFYAEDDINQAMEDAHSGLAVKPVVRFSENWS